MVVMAGPAAGRVPAIHAFSGRTKDVDGRDKHGHDDAWLYGNGPLATQFAEPDSRGLVPAIHVFSGGNKDVDARDKPYDMHTSLPRFQP